MHEIRVQYQVERQLFERRVSLQGRDLPIASTACSRPAISCRSPFLRIAVIALSSPNECASNTCSIGEQVFNGSLLQVNVIIDRAMMKLGVDLHQMSDSMYDDYRTFAWVRQARA